MTAPTLPPEVAHPFSPAGRAAPYPAYQWLRETAPAYYDPTARMWLLTNHEYCTLVMRDRRFSASLGQTQRARDDDLPASMLTTDPPDHNRLRAPGALLLGPAAVRTLADELDADVDALLDSLGTGGTVDVSAAIGEPLAVAVFARVLRLPDSERATFADLARRVAVNLDPMARGPVAVAGRAAMGELSAYLAEHVRMVVRTEPESALARLAGDTRLTQPEMLGILGLAVVGGYQPLADLPATALAVLLPVPGAVEVLAAADLPAAGAIVDEVVRLESPIPFIARVTTSEVELGDVTLPANARVLAVTAAANRDPDVFDRPDEPVLDRASNPHLALGGGPHLCLGAPLVRTAGGVLLSRLAARFPRQRPVGTDLTWAPSLIPRRLVGYAVDLG